MNATDEELEEAKELCRRALASLVGVPRHDRYSLTITPRILQIIEQAASDD